MLGSRAILIFEHSFKKSFVICHGPKSVSRFKIGDPILVFQISHSPRRNCLRHVTENSKIDLLLSYCGVRITSIRHIPFTLLLHCRVLS